MKLVVYNKKPESYNSDKYYIVKKKRETQLKRKFKQFILTNNTWDLEWILELIIYIYN